MHCSWVQTNDKPHPKLVSALNSWRLFNWSWNTLLDFYEIRMLVVVLTGQHPKPADSFISSRCIHFPRHLSRNPFLFSGQVLHLHKTTRKITVLYELLHSTDCMHVTCGLTFRGAGSNVNNLQDDLHGRQRIVYGARREKYRGEGPTLIQPDQTHTTRPL